MNLSDNPADSPIRQIKDWPSLLEQIRCRPGMWIGQSSLPALNHFIGGFELAEIIHEIPEDRRIGGFPWQEFEKWVDDRFNQKDRLSIRSFGMALRMTNFESEAFDLWFQWYDQFNRQHGIV